jgi:hypothetical protein
MKEKQKRGRPPEIPADPAAKTSIGPLACRAADKRAILDFTAAMNVDLSDFVIRATLNEIKRVKTAMAEVMK